MNNLDKQYQALLQDILENGVEKKDRTGTGTLSVFGRTIRHDMKTGFPLLTTKRLYFKGIVTELLWFLRGDTNIKYLVDNNCHIWDGDAYKFFKNSFPIKKSNPPKDYLNENGQLFTQEEFINKIKTDDAFAKKWGELGPIYGKQWRGFSYVDKGDFINTDTSDDPLVGGRGLFYQPNEVDQIQNLIKDLKTNPDSRRLMVTAWNPGQLEEMVLPPCHYGFQVYTRELTWEEQVQWVMKNTDVEMENLYIVEEIAKDSTPKRAISLMFNMRSNDVPLGLPFNIASYGLLLEIIGRMVNMIPDELIANLGDAHIYNNQIDGVKEQLTRTPMKLPNLIISDEVNFNGTIDEFLETCNKDSFKLDGYKSHPSIKMPLSN